MATPARHMCFSTFRALIQAVTGLHAETIFFVKAALRKEGILIECVC